MTKTVAKLIYPSAFVFYDTVLTNSACIMGMDNSRKLKAIQTGDLIRGAREIDWIEISTPDKYVLYEYNGGDIGIKSMQDNLVDARQLYRQMKDRWEDD